MKHPEIECNTVGIRQIDDILIISDDERKKGEIRQSYINGLELEEEKRLKYEKLDEVKLKIGHCNIILIDEVSMTNAYLFVELDEILKQAFETEKPFGGKSIILLGDICQLPPNGDYSLAEILASFQSNNQKIFKVNDA